MDLMPCLCGSCHGRVFMDRVIMRSLWIMCRVLVDRAFYLCPYGSSNNQVLMDLGRVFMDRAMAVSLWIESL